MVARLLLVLASVSFLTGFPAVGLFGLQLAEINFEAIKAIFPEAAVFFEPLVDFLERTHLDAAGPPLRLAATRDQSGALQYLEMLRDGRKAHLERFGQLRH